MFALNLLRAGVLIYLSAITPGFADTPQIIDHVDVIEVDQSLNLADIVNLTLEQYPDSSWLQALEEEAAAIQGRSDSLLAGAPSVGLAFQEATSGTLHYIDATLHAPLWNFGQRDAERTLAQMAQASSKSQAGALHIRVAGLIRVALWDLELQNVRHEQAKLEVDVTTKLVEKVKKLHDLGEIPRSDVLLAKTELLQKRSQLTLAEAEVMHARKRYQSITRINRIPASFREILVDLAEISENHLALVAMNSEIARKQAEIKTIEYIGSGQNNVAIGVNSDRGDSRSNRTESFNISVNIPFGGKAHLAPQVAAANLELNKMIAAREQLIRDLELAHHEAEHNLQVNKAELKTANELMQIAEDHLKMTELSYSVGEINLMDLLKIQARTQQAILQAKERTVIMQRDIALYNQAVGVLP